jgi:hypothetical protein
MQTWKPIFLATAALSTLGGLSGCGDDAAQEFTLTLLADRVTLTSDGRDSASIRVSVLDQDFSPPPQGSEVALTVAPSGTVNGTADPVARAVTDEQGFAEFTVACTNEEPIAIVAILEGARGRLSTPINCQAAPSGDWTISTTAEPRRILPDSVSSLTIRATDSSGDPVPQGTSVTLEVTSGDLSFSRGGSTLVRSMDAAGTLAATVQAGLTESTGTICANFTDPSFGSGPSCVAIVVSAREVTEANCIGTLSAPRAPADGQTVTTVTMTVSDRDGNPVPGAAVTLAAATGSLVDAPRDGVALSGSLSTDTAGDASAYIISPAIGGSADLTAEAIIVEDGAERVLECEFSDNLVFFGAPACRFDSMTPALIGVTNSGIPETGTVTFCFEQTREVPVSAGQRVNFEFESTLTGLRAEATTGITDELGCASIEVTAGQISGLFEVRATVPFGDSESTCTSGALPVRHGRPTANGWSIVCNPRTVGSLVDSAGIDIFTGCPVVCSGYLRDRFGNPVNSGDTQIFLASEQGFIDSPVTPDDTGRFTAQYYPNGTIPADVEPNPEEPGVTLIQPFQGRPAGTTLNPRDFVTTIIAYTIGEEAFFDENGNGYYDEEETFIDLPEPFVDKDDNNAYDGDQNPADVFIDTETQTREFNGEWDNINRVWEPNTVIWTQTNLGLSGIVKWGPVEGRDDDEPLISNSASSPRDYYSAIVLGNRAYFPGQEIRASSGTFTRLIVELMDKNFNALGAGTTIIAELDDACATLDIQSDTLGVGFGARFFGSSESYRSFASYDEAGNQVDFFDEGAYATIIREFNPLFGPDGSLDDVLRNVVLLKRVAEPIGDTPNCVLTFTITQGATEECSDIEIVSTTSFEIEP